MLSSDAVIINFTELFHSFVHCSWHVAAFLLLAWSSTKFCRHLDGERI